MIRLRPGRRTRRCGGGCFLWRVLRADQHDRLLNFLHTARSRLHAEQRAVRRCVPSSSPCSPPPHDIQIVVSFSVPPSTASNFVSEFVPIPIMIDEPTFQAHRVTAATGFVEHDHLAEMASMITFVVTFPPLRSVGDADLEGARRLDQSSYPSFEPALQLRGPTPISLVSQLHALQSFQPSAAKTPLRRISATTDSGMAVRWGPSGRCTRKR